MGYDESRIVAGMRPANAEDAGKSAMFQHQCPVCEKRHWVNQARHSVAWGKQFTCGRECEVRLRKRWREHDD